MVAVMGHPKEGEAARLRTLLHAERVARCAAEREAESWKRIARRNALLLGKPAALDALNPCECGAPAQRRCLKEGWHWVECSRCHHLSSGAWAASGAAKFWNTRHAPKPAAPSGNGGAHGSGQTTAGGIE